MEKSLNAFAGRARHSVRAGAVSSAIWVIAVFVVSGSFVAESKSPEAGEPANAQSAYPNSTGQLVWDTLRGHFRMLFTLDPPATNWIAIKRERPNGAAGEYESGDYLLKIREKSKAREKTCLINYELTRIDDRPFRVLENRIECKTSYSGVYKIFEPGSFSQQNYKIDLPFRINNRTRAEVDQPVFWTRFRTRPSKVQPTTSATAVKRPESPTATCASFSIASIPVANRLPFSRMGFTSTPTRTLPGSKHWKVTARPLTRRAISKVVRQAIGP
jgi:hypothetical protein